MPYINETISLGNSTGRIKNYYANGLIVIYDVNGEFNPGDVVTCDESGETFILPDNFELDLSFDLYYEDHLDDWSNSTLICQDDGAYIVLDAHFTGKPSQNNQTTNLIYQDNN